MTRSLLLAVVAVTAVVVAGTAHGAGAGGVTGPAFYVDGTLYRTVATPTDLSRTGAPPHTYDTIYEFFGEQPNVATAAPGDLGYNGGRWLVQLLGFPGGYDAAVASADANASGDIDSDEELHDAFQAGTATVIGSGPSFVCPVIKVPRG